MVGALHGRRATILAIALGGFLLAGAFVALPAATAADAGGPAADSTGYGSAVATAGTGVPLVATANGSPASAAAQSQPAVDVEIEQTARGNLFLTNETPSVVLDADGADLAWTARDHDGRIAASGTATVDGETTVEIPIDGVGHYTLRVRSAADGAESGGDAAGPDAGPRGTLARTTLSVVPADGFDTDDEFFAMSTKFGAGRDHAMMETLESIGVAAVRDEHGWHGVEQTRGEYDFSGPRYAGFMQSLRERGFDRLFLAVYANQLYADEWEGIFTFPATEEARQGYANYTRAVLREYPELEHVEVWNEPNIESFSVGPAGQDPTAYARLLEATHDAVEETRPDVTVVGGSTTRNHTGTNQIPPGIDYGYWEGIYEAGGAEHMDAAAIHLYRRQPEEFAEDLDRFDDLTREYTGGETFPVWVTELGWPTAPHFPGGDGEAMQARHLVQSHARLRAAGVERYYWYTQVDTFYEENVWQVDDGNNQFGLLRGEDSPLGAYAPKPGYPAYATMTRQLAGTAFRRSSTEPVQQYVFDGDGGPVRVLWAAERTDLTIRTDAPLTVTTMTGEQQRLHPVDGEVYLTVGPDPRYVSGAIDGMETGAPVGIRAPVVSGDGASGGELTASVENGAGGSTERTVTHEVGGETVSLTAGPGDEATGALPVSAAYGDRAALAVDTVSVDGQVVGRLATPVGVPRAHFADPAFVTGMTVETANEGRRTGFSEVNDVGTDHSAFAATSRAGVPCYESDVDAGVPGRTLYVDVADDHTGGLGDVVPVTVRYFDDGEGTFGVEYADGTVSGSATEAVELDGDGRWETHTFELDDAAFPTASGDLVNNGALDLEVTLQGSLIGVSEGDVCFESVTLGTEPTSSIDPTEDGGGDTGDDTGGDDTDGNADRDDTGGESGSGATTDDGSDTEDGTGAGSGNGSVDGDAGSDDGLPGFGLGSAIVALAACVAVLGRARRRV